MALVEWLDSKLPHGLWRLVGKKWLKSFYECYSLNYKCKRCIRRRLNKLETPEWVSELYQSAWFLFAIIALLIGRPISSLKFLDAMSLVLIVLSLFALYRVFEMALFAVYWVLIEDKPLHSYKRSLVGFILNLAELSVFFAFGFVAFNCPTNNLARVTALWYSIMNIVTIGIVGPEPESLICRSLVVTELVIADFLLIIVIANLVGALRKKEKREG